MTKISLATYTIKVKNKINKSDNERDIHPDDKYLKLDNLEYSTLYHFEKGPQTVFILKNLLLNNESVEFNDKMLDGSVPDDIKLKVVLNGNPRTFTVSNPNQAAPYRDISTEITKADDGHPDFNKIHEIALEYADEIFK